MAKRKKVIAVYVSEEDWQRASQLAEDESLTLSTLLLRLMRQAYKDRFDNDGMVKKEP